MNVLVVCAAGMSSSSFVFKMRKEIMEQSLNDIKVGSCASNQLERYIGETDLILLTPQLAYFKDELEKIYPDMIVKMIPALVYGNHNVQEAIKLISSNRLDDHNEVNQIKIIQLLYKIAVKVRKNNFINALSDAFIRVLPVTVIGSIALLIKNVPFLFIQEIIDNTVIYELLQRCVDISTNMISLYVCYFIAFNYSKYFKVPSQMVGLNSLISFLMIAGIHPNGYIMTDYLGAKGLFTAIFTAYISTRVFISIYKFNSKFSQSINKIGTQKIIDSFTSFIPVVVNVLIYVIIVSFFRFIFNDTLPNLINLFIQEKLSSLVGNNIYSELSLLTIAQGLWFFGIHGGNIIGAITQPLYAPLALVNLMAVNQGLDIPYMITSKFRFMFVFGGAGSTLGLVILMFFLAKSSHLKNIGRISLPLGIFFINETVLFGLPIVMNPIMLIPFIFIPLISGILTAIVMKIGIVPYAVGIEIPWTTPPIISGFIQGGYVLAFWQILMIILSIFLWYPFFRILDKQFINDETH